MSAKYVVGIDLGTTHCALASAELSDDAAKVAPFSVPQIVARGELGGNELLPSFLYFAHDETLPLPWDSSRAFAVGAYARVRAAEAASRVVSSAKSWLSHPGIDRRGQILPVGAPDDIEKISPVETSWRYLEHLTEAWDQAHPGAPLAEQEVVLTVPASFDPSARELTVEAALAAGLDGATLLEEPQAALYAWIGARGDAWRKELRPGDVLLVVDVGGGTTDFSAIAAVDQGGSLDLVRVAVGDHILLGGDNMDLALAYLVKAKLEAGGAEIDRMQLAALGHACRTAKEKLLGDPKIKEVPVVLAARGAKLLGGSLRSELTRKEVESALVDGFFPVVDAAARPVVRARGALTQLGLPYASDAAITKHLAAFLGRQATALDALEGFARAPDARAPRLLHPSAVLFNGGVMKSPLLRERVMNTLNAWLEADGAKPSRALEGADLDLAVAQGAARYGLVRRGRGLRIRGGTAQSYYVGIEGAAPAVPGVDPPITAMCVAPFGMEEGTSATLPPHELGVVVGEKVTFRFFGSTVRREDHAGSSLERWKGDELVELSPIEVTLPADGRREGDVVPVELHAQVTEVGTLVLEAVPKQPKKPDERWKVELSVRES